MPQIYTKFVTPARKKNKKIIFTFILVFRIRLVIFEYGKERNNNK